MHGHRVVVTKPGQVELEAFEVGEPAADEVLVATRASLVSPGTERAFYLALPNTNATYPLYPGYSVVGEVIAAGSSVTRFSVGERVACPVTHSSHVIAKADKCLPLPDGLDESKAVFFNLIAIAMQGVRKARVELGEPVLVLGAGPIGLFAMQLARLSGGLPVLAVDLDETRLGAARAVGVDATILSDDRLLENVQAHTRGEGAAVVIEATGVPALAATAFQLAAVRGRVVLLGSSRGEADGINFYRDVHRKGLTIIGGHEITRPRYENSPGWWTQIDEQRIALDLLARGRIDVAPLITHRFGWQAFAEAYDILADRRTDALGMVIDWS